MTDATAAESFDSLDLPRSLVAALEEVGYEAPTPIQCQAIPLLLQGQDLLGNAPTGTGKTAAFALPLLARADVSKPQVQILTLTPTRELAIQVAEAFQTYASAMKGFHVLPIYGGQDYSPQLQRLRRGVHVVVGTPGRIRDHLQRGSLKLDALQAVVLDEADEMLRMGFIDEVEWILQQTPKKRQMALFSATMPKPVRSIARRFMNEPHEISITTETGTADTIHQRFWLVSGVRKLEALTRILEVEPIDAVLIFVRTKSATAELADRLEARGYAAAAMNGDMPQRQREQTVEKLKKGGLDILIATDVAARGLDVDRISHVINFDIPYDTEAYIHRIGRTGRAGRSGQAILFVAPRERRMLGAIERATKQRIEELKLPTTETVNNKRIAGFKQKIADTLAAGDLAFMQNLVEQFQQEHNVPALDIAAALAQMVIAEKPLQLQHGNAQPRSAGESSVLKSRLGHKRKSSRVQYEMFRVEVGHDHDTKPGNIIGAIANEAGLSSDNIGHLDIKDAYSTIELPVGMPDELLRDLQKVWVSGQTLRISRLGAPRATPDRESAKPSEKRRKHPHEERSKKARNAPRQDKTKKNKNKKNKKKAKRSNAEKGVLGLD